MNLLITQNSQNLQHTHNFDGIAHSHSKGTLSGDSHSHSVYIGQMLNGVNSGKFIGLGVGNSNTDVINRMKNISNYYGTQLNYTVSGGLYFAHNGISGAASGNNNVSITNGSVVSLGVNISGSTESVKATGTIANSGNSTEARPVDYTYKIWKRTA